MRKTLLSLLAIILIVSSGCKSGAAGDPKTVLSNFFDAIAKKDFTAVKKYSTKDSESMLNMVQMGMDNSTDSSQIMQYEKDNIVMGDAVIVNDKATIPVKEKKSGESTDFTLKKENGDWKVAFDKSTLMEMAQKKMKEGGMMNHMRDHNMPTLDSASNSDIKNAQKMMDSANKILEEAKRNNDK